MNRFTAIRNAVSAVIEPMENRRLMSVSLSGGYLHVTGTGNADNILIEHSGNKAYVTTQQAVTPVTLPSGFKGVKVDLKGGNDRFATKSWTFPVTVNGGAGRDTITGGFDNDYLYGGAGDDRIDGGHGDDYLNGEDGSDTLFGNGGNDDLNGGRLVEKDEISGGADVDLVRYHDHVARVNVSLDGLGNDGAANEYDYLHGDIENVMGTAYSDTLVGSDGPNMIYGLAGDNHLTGKAGNDYLLGGQNTDFIWGGKGNDTLAGGAGNDVMYGNEDHDKLIGDEGDDVLEGNAGGDTLSGGRGKDDLRGGGGVDTIDLRNAPSMAVIDQDNVADDRDGYDAAYNNVRDDIEIIHGTQYGDTITGGALANVIYGWGGQDILRGGGGHDALEGGDASDTLYGDAGRDTLRGGAENDELFGGDDADKLFGDDGRDGLNGGTGTDTLTGGAHTDRFVDQRRLKTDNTLPVTAEDKLVDRGGTDYSVVYSDTKSTTDRYAGRWSETEIGTVDNVIKALQRVVGNARVLEPDGGTVYFDRQGGQRTPAGEWPVFSGFGDDRTTLFDHRSFKDTATLKRDTLTYLGLTAMGNRWTDGSQVSDFHYDWLEAANWYDGTGIPDKNEWVRCSSGIGNFYRKGSKFVSERAKAGAHIDFAETFAKILNAKAQLGYTFAFHGTKEAFVNDKVFDLYS